MTQKEYYTRKLISEATLCLTGIASALALLGALIQYWKDDANQQKIIDNHSEYTWYIDGKEVNYDKINLNQYEMTYDLDKNEVYLH